MFLLCCCLLGPLLCVSFHWYAFCLLVVLRLSYQYLPSDWLEIVIVIGSEEA